MILHGYGGIIQAPTSTHFTVGSSAYVNNASGREFT